MIKKQVLLFLWIFFAQISQAQTTPYNTSKVNNLLKTLKNPTSKEVMVIAHRGDWRNAPENSIQAIKNVIEMGVDMVEIDIQKTKDDQLILMHDITLDRTSTGKGKIENFTLEELQKLYLRNGAGIATSHKIPTLEEALIICKGKILVNLDKGYNYFEDAYKIAKKTGTTSQIIIKGSKNYDQVFQEQGDILKDVIYMPIVNLNKPNARQIIKDFSEKLRPAAFELVFNSDTSSLLQQFNQIKKNGSRVWVNSLWPSLNAGHHDDMAVEENKPEESWGWIIAKGANMIQTDRPELLLQYLRKKGIHK